MTTRFLQARRWQCAGLRLAVAAMLLRAAPWLPAQSSGDFSKEQPHHPAKGRSLPERLPAKASQPPAFSIPTAPLGFSAPGPLYLGQSNSLASLDFLDENRLLFTFRVPGLIRRKAGDAGQGDERQIRAVLLALPAGTVLSEAVWTLHDRLRYLWMLRDGHFLVRDRDLLQQGDATLELKPLLRFPGPLTWMELDPLQLYMVTDSREPVAVEAKPGDVSSPATASANMVEDGVPQDEQKDIVVRILRRESGQVMMVSRTRSSIHLPINSEGYVESLRGSASQWTLVLNYFNGGSRALGQVDSACTPTLEFVAQKEVLATTCDSAGGRRMVALTTDGRRLWQDDNAVVPVWPLLVRSPDGSRLARESLAVTHAVNAMSPLGSDDIKGQVVEVFDAATGQMALAAAASPVLDAGGNVAISPSGRRIAVISDGAIQVFELPAPPELP